MKQNPVRVDILSTMFAAQMNYAELSKLNHEFMSRGRGKSGRIPHGKTFIKSVANQVDHTNRIGHFS